MTSAASTLSEFGGLQHAPLGLKLYLHDYKE